MVHKTPITKQNINEILNIVYINITLLHPCSLIYLYILSLLFLAFIKKHTRDTNKQTKDVIIV